MRARVCVCVCVCVLGEFAHDKDDIVRIRHAVQEVERLAPQRLIGVLQTVDDHHLGGEGVGGGVGCGRGVI